MTSELYIGDFNELASTLPKVNLIYTDPPYKKSEGSIQCYQMLARHAPDLLEDGGSLVTIVPHYLLEEVMSMMSGRLKYRWIYCMDQEDGSHPRMAMGVEVMWKPMLHYVQRAYPNGRGFLRDKIKIPGPTKNEHKYQQHEAWAEYYIEKLTKPGDIVLDPFMGSGTVPYISAKLGRGYIGIDIDPEVTETVLWRLSGLEK